MGEIFSKSELVEDIVKSKSKRTIEDKNKYSNIRLDHILKMTLQTSDSKLRLSKNEKSFPVMISVKETELEKIENQKNDEDDATVDLFCVIDRSGSMGGEKLEILKKSLKYCLELLKPNDRISLVQFDHTSQIILACLLYTSDAAEDMQCEDLGGRRIIKKI